MHHVVFLAEDPVYFPLIGAALVLSGAKAKLVAASKEEKTVKWETDPPATAADTLLWFVSQEFTESTSQLVVLPSDPREAWKKFEEFYSKVNKLWRCWFDGMAPVRNALIDDNQRQALSMFVSKKAQEECKPHEKRPSVEALAFAAINVWSQLFDKTLDFDAALIEGYQHLAVEANKIDQIVEKMGKIVALSTGSFSQTALVPKQDEWEQAPFYQELAHLRLKHKFPDAQATVVFDAGLEPAGMRFSVNLRGTVDTTGEHELSPLIAALLQNPKFQVQKSWEELLLTPSSSQ